MLLLCTLPPVLDPTQVQEYSAATKAGEGYIWVRCLNIGFNVALSAAHPMCAMAATSYYPFDTYVEALEYSENNPVFEAPLGLAL